MSSLMKETYCFSHNRPSIRLFPLGNSEYFQEIWRKFKASSDNVQRKRTVTPRTCFTELCPLCLLVKKSCPLCNLKKVQDIFTKL